MLTSWTDKGLPKHNLSVVIGRFQPIHNGHFQMIQDAFKYGEIPLILIGSAFKSRDIKNPFTFQERKDALRAAFPELNPDCICPIRDDLYNDNVWVRNVQSTIEAMHAHQFGTLTKLDVALMGHYKDESSYYLHSFPQYRFIETGMKTDNSSTDIRRDLFCYKNIQKAASCMPGYSKQWLLDWCSDHKDIYDNLCEEYKFIDNYKKPYAHLKHAPIFVTVDAVVICKGHVLLVERRCAPGKGLMALPGGFLEQRDRISGAIIRELQEETSIGVSIAHLQAGLKFVRSFDHPDRSLRGRTITHAGLISLDHMDVLPRIRGQESEVSDVRWVPLSKFCEMESQMFEDHYHIVNHMIGQAS